MRKPFWMYPAITYGTMEGEKKGRLLRFEDSTMTVIPPLRDRLHNRWHALRWRLTVDVPCTLGDALRTLANWVDGGEA